MFQKHVIHFSEICFSIPKKGPESNARAYTILTEALLISTGFNNAEPNISIPCQAKALMNESLIRKEAERSGYSLFKCTILVSVLWRGGGNLVLTVPQLRHELYISSHSETLLLEPTFLV
jgi:hypothetical protein